MSWTLWTLSQPFNYYEAALRHPFEIWSLLYKEGHVPPSQHSDNLTKATCRQFHVCPTTYDPVRSSYSIQSTPPQEGGYPSPRRDIPPLAKMKRKIPPQSGPLNAYEWTMKYDRWTMNYEIWPMNYDIWTTKREFGIPNYELWTMNNELWTMSYKLWTMNYELWTMNIELWTMSSELWALTVSGIRNRDSIRHGFRPGDGQILGLS